MTGQSVVRRRVVVTGRVQGVFFRTSCRTQAVSQGVAGWVRNRDDGAVEAVFEGPPAAVDAVVEGVTVDDEQPEGLTGFSVR